VSVRKPFHLAATVSFAAAAVFFASCSRDAEAARKIEKTNRDLRELAAGLEAFKREYGDYPQVPVDELGSREWLSSRRLWASLRGKRGSGMEDAERVPRRRDFFVAGTRLETARVPGFSGYDVDYPVDPWGNGYRYRYIPDLDRGRYELYSMGPDGDAILGRPRDQRLLREGAAVNADNLFAR
jgi:hypothetical protein